MKLEDLVSESKVEPLHRDGESSLSIIKSGQIFRFVVDHRSGEIDRQHMGSISMHPEIGHGMGAVRD